MCDKKLLAGRLLLIAFVVFASLTKLMNIDLYASTWAAAGIPLSGTALVVGISLVELGCALAVAVGFKARTAASILAVFVVTAIPVYYDFWNVTGDARILKLNGLFLYLALAGGFLMVAAAGTGRYSVERA